MQFRTTGLLLLGAMELPASGTAQTAPAPLVITRTVVAATKLTVTDVPLHFKAVNITLQPDESSSVSAANGTLYQMSQFVSPVLGLWICLSACCSSRWMCPYCKSPSLAPWRGSRRSGSG